MIMHVSLVLGSSSCRHECAVCITYRHRDRELVGMLTVRVSEVFQELDSTMLPLFHNGLDQHGQELGRVDTAFMRSSAPSDFSVRDHDRYKMEAAKQAARHGRIG